MRERSKPETGPILDRMIAYRRDFHKYAEAGWNEIRTASLIADRLVELGYRIEIGREIIDPGSRMGVPGRNVLNHHYRRALQQGAVKKFADQVKNGYTAVMTEIGNGKEPVIGLRFDIDALGVEEAKDPGHRPWREGFASVNQGVMHACGHDGHAATGLGLAELLRIEKASIKGTVRLIFQPAEEGVRGAKSLVMAGIVDDLDYLIGFHLLSGMKVGRIASGMGGYAATSKFDVIMTGKPAHAGGEPQKGKNALLAAANAVLNLYAISRHSNGATRLNVGKLNAGTGRNVICPQAVLEIETRGANNELNSYMFKKAEQVIRNSARMYECRYKIIFRGEAPTADSDPALIELVEKSAAELGNIEYNRMSKTGGSEDFTYMMKRVQEHGGLAVNIGIGAAPEHPGTGHGFPAHTSYFDFDEKAMQTAILLLAKLIRKLTKSPG